MASQPVTEPATRHAIFLVVTLSFGRQESVGGARPLRRSGRARSGRRSARSSGAALVCRRRRLRCLGRAVRAPRPAELHTLARDRRRVRVTRSRRRAISSSTSARNGWISASSSRSRSSRGSEGALSAADEVHGFRYFDDRDLTGFVDGTENPVGQDAVDATSVGDEDPDLRRRQLRARAEVRARPGHLGRPSDRGAGADHRSHQALRHRARRRGEADERTQRADGDRRGRRGGRHPPPQHAVRARERRVRHLLHRLRPLAPGPRADAREHVRRPSTGELRPAARLHPPGDRHALLCSLSHLPLPSGPRT